MREERCYETGVERRLTYWSHRGCTDGRKHAKSLKRSLKEDPRQTQQPVPGQRIDPAAGEDGLTGLRLPLLGQGTSLSS